MQVTVLTCSLRIPGRELRPGTTIRIFSNPLRWLFSIRVQMYLKEEEDIVRSPKKTTTQECIFLVDREIYTPATIMAAY